ncbi:hypothetical protein CJ232_10200 [Hoylesella timonensis]|uniref:Uncharacterized protein n=1 Tax=Hoylesella timonensis TaxID=386414 RepID=A0A2N6Q3K6_9BACT|nr:hypothetical protein CJ232_10200 [Hoylesella timonensis]
MLHKVQNFHLIAASCVLTEKYHDSSFFNNEKRKRKKTVLQKIFHGRTYQSYLKRRKSSLQSFTFDEG